MGGTEYEVLGDRNTVFFFSLFRRRKHRSDHGLQVVEREGAAWEGSSAEQQKPLPAQDVA
jgi:hypothetical protein